MLCFSAYSFPLSLTTPKGLSPLLPLIPFPFETFLPPAYGQAFILTRRISPVIPGVSDVLLSPVFRTLFFQCHPPFSVIRSAFKSRGFAPFFLSAHLPHPSSFNPQQRALSGKAPFPASRSHCGGAKTIHMPFFQRSNQHETHSCLRTQIRCLSFDLCTYLLQELTTVLIFVFFFFFALL